MTTARNSRVLRTIPLLIAVCFISFDAPAQCSGGTGEPNDPYQIATAEDLMLLGKSPWDYDKHFILTADIDLDPNLPGGKVLDRAIIAPDVNDTNYDSWGGAYFDGKWFTGVFDGNGHSISHLTIAGDGSLGLIGRLESGGQIKDLGMIQVNITGSGDAIGGLVGYSHDGEVIRCHSTAVVSGRKHVGGLVGYNVEGAVTQCFSTCTVSGGGWGTGGLIGDNYRGTVANCYSIANTSGDDRHTGVLVGYDFKGNVISSFWDIWTDPLATSEGGIGLSTAEMQTASTFLNAGWDFVDEVANGTEDIWWILEGQDYPRLWWEVIAEN